MGVKTVKWKGVVNDDITLITQLLLFLSNVLKLVSHALVLVVSSLTSVLFRLQHSLARSAVHQKHWLEFIYIHTHIYIFSLKTLVQQRTSSAVILGKIFSEVVS